MASVSSSVHVITYWVEKLENWAGSVSLRRSNTSSAPTAPSASAWRQACGTEVRSDRRAEIPCEVSWPPIVANTRFPVARHDGASTDQRSRILEFTAAQIHARLTSQDDSSPAFAPARVPLVREAAAASEMRSTRVGSLSAAPEVFLHWLAQWAFSVIGGPRRRRILGTIADIASAFTGSTCQATATQTGWEHPDQLSASRTAAVRPTRIE